MKRRGVLIFAAGFITGLVVACAGAWSFAYFQIADLSEQLTRASARADQAERRLATESDRHAQAVAEMKETVDEIKANFARMKKEAGKDDQNK